MEARILQAFTDLGVSPRTTPRGMSVALRMGVMKREALLDLPQAISALPKGEEAAIASNFARGVLSVINEPGNSAAESMSFLDTTPVIAPCAEGPGFEEGVLAAGGSRPFFQPYVGDLRLAYYIDLDEGQRLLTEAQVTQWGVHPERIEKAGLSIMFHRSGYQRWENHLVDGVLIHRLAIGDGSDAARGALLEMFDYYKAQSGRYFAAPESNTFLFTDELSDASLAVIKKVAEGAYQKSTLPLSRGIFRIHKGKLTPDTVDQF